MFSRLVAVIALAAVPGFCGDWSPRLAAEYLDARQKEWAQWPAAKATGGTCLSCHTGLTYLLARPNLGRALGESEPTSYETGLMDGLRARLEKKTAAELSPTAKEPFATQKMGVEAIFSALFLTLQDSGRATLSAEAKQAFDRLWSLQIREGKAQGSWAWFDLNLDPWETPDSAFYGASLAALAAGSAPAEYRGQPEVRQGVAALTEYLQREQQAQPLHNRLTLLWASSKLPSALPEPMRRPSSMRFCESSNRTEDGRLSPSGPLSRIRMRRRRQAATAMRPPMLRSYWNGRGLRGRIQIWCGL